MKIAFVHNSNAFIPEIEAYSQYFSTMGIACDVGNAQYLKHIDYDIAWYFMGSDLSPQLPGKYKIHEYCSASTPPFASVKNYFKRSFNSIPDFRIFLNDAVRTSFNFQDDIPFGYRDMGIPKEWILPSRDIQVPLYDFVYIGDISKARQPDRLFTYFTHGVFKDQSLLVISNEYSALQKKYAQYTNIHFEGPYPHDQIISHIRKAQFGFNYIPNIAPFNIQTSTKLLEYLAAGLHIVSTDYKWIRNFQNIYGGYFFYLDEEASDIPFEYFNQFKFESSDLTTWTWEAQIKKSGILAFLDQVAANKKG